MSDGEGHNAAAESREEGEKLEELVNHQAKGDDPLAA